MAESSRVHFALRQLRSSDWEAFERFCGAFFADEFPTLHSISGPGDKARDGVLFVTEQSGVVLQYSIVEDWRGKIRQTVNRLRQADIACTVLIYGTNQDIGPRADDLIAELRVEGVSLDVRDLRYFTDRVNRSLATRQAVAELTARIVDPLLPAKELVKNSDLPAQDLRAGLLYLELQLHDADNQQNLTKLCIDALILSVLAETNAGDTKTQADIIGEIRQRFPHHDALRLRELVGGSLERLKRQRRVTFTRSSGAHSLHYSERQLLAQKAETMVAERQVVRDAIADRVREAAESLAFPGTPADSAALVDAMEATFEALLDRYGTDFVATLRGDASDVEAIELYDVARTVVFSAEPQLRQLGDLADVAELVVEASGRVLAYPGESLQRYLRNLADAYTMLAFLRETPDVKRALENVFHDGRLVLDATVLLPCFAETRLPEAERPFTNVGHVLSSGVRTTIVSSRTISWPPPVWAPPPHPRWWRSGRPSATPR